MTISTTKTRIPWIFKTMTPSPPVVAQPPLPNPLARTWTGKSVDGNFNEINLDAVQINTEVL
jgi:hypothetical protein